MGACGVSLLEIALTKISHISSVNRRLTCLLNGGSLALHDENFLIVSSGWGTH